TERAVRAFQTKYGVSPVGRVGPATRAKLQEVFGGTTPVTPAAVSAPDTSAQEKQLQELLNQIQLLQNQLKASQPSPNVPVTPMPLN
ncbi:MAG: peptidoglycan-binding domain-containing protein, partial [bacterium]|nr:peptidoglycan-binding domain-containing protein [bacterium]